MYLEKLEIQGFKSFASKNILVFPGMLDKTRRGITAIVGPNGSGKSNIADAVRWALGEQSMKALRGKRAEDIIFSGSDKKGKLGMAEVSLFLNNESRQAPIDYSEVVITRRLFRNGDSEYMLNNNRVRLSDIQMMLAKAKFGQKTYSVIGQGMVEGFLNTSLAERKEFFDEATGVKQYQIKRDESLNKLKGSYENLIQAQMLLSEIEPRLRSLTRQVNRLKKRDEIEKELKKLQIHYYSYVWHSINNKFKQYNNKFLELEKIKIDKDRKLEQLNRKLEELKTEGGENEYFTLQENLNKAQVEKEEISKKFAKIEAQIEMKLEANGQIDLSFLLNKKEELISEISSIKEEIFALEKNIGYAKEKGREIKAEKEAVNKKIEDLNKKLKSFDSEGEFARSVKNKLKKVLEKLRILGSESRIEKIKEMAQNIKEEIKMIISEPSHPEVEADNKKAGNIQEELNRLFKESDMLTVKMNENNLRVSARFERVKLLKEKIDGLNKEIEEIGEKLKQKSGEFNYKEISDQQNELKQELDKAQKNIDDIKDKINRVREDEEKSKNKLFSLQNELQTLQKEINETNYELNELKVNSTRHETKLEALEIEIREEYGNLKEVKDKKVEAGIDYDAKKDKEKIRQLKRQLELIGGIDPEVEREYNSTKERYDFLSGQVNDFISAVDSLKKIIKELDLIIKERFDKEFKIIAGNFEKYFKILFNGGRARIIKVMEEIQESSSAEVSEDEETSEEEADLSTLQSDSGQASSGQGKKSQEELSMADLKKIKFLQRHNATGLAGIEIKATPPGKKITSVAMLSGGERALTAIALICAIIYSNPSPFVVLDEVDAALDEANSERLAKILDELSHKTQFILITHNRATMRKANVLYGITMADDGVSKLLSVKLEEANKVVKS